MLACSSIPKVHKNILNGNNNIYNIEFSLKLGQNWFPWVGTSFFKMGDYRRLALCALHNIEFLNKLGQNWFPWVGHLFKMGRLSAFLRCAPS